MQVITLAANMLMGEHARSRLPAALLLSNLAQRAEYSGKVADVALLSLSSILMETGPGWAQAQQLQVGVKLALGIQLFVLSIIHVMIYFIRPFSIK